jgi:hypothetical protein
VVCARLCQYCQGFPLRGSFDAQRRSYRDNMVVEACLTSWSRALRLLAGAA